MLTKFAKKCKKLTQENKQLKEKLAQLNKKLKRKSCFLDKYGSFYDKKN